METQIKKQIIKYFFVSFAFLVSLCLIATFIIAIDSKTSNRTTADDVSAVPTNTDTWNDEGNYSVVAPQGSGTENDPYLISTAEELAWISVNYAGAANGAYFLQTANIDLGAHYWVPINNNYENYEYFYCYDGGGYEIENLYISFSMDIPLGSFGIPNGYKRVGLFGTIYGSEENYCYVRNVKITNGQIDVLGVGPSYTGAVVGFAGYTDFDNCFSRVNINAVYGYIGGINGYNSRANITNCINEGDVIATTTSAGQVQNIGGVVADFGLGAISDCVNQGDIISDGTGSYYLGGIVGSFYNTEIISCYNTGNVTSNYSTGVGSRIGGIAGSAGNSNSISKCYNTGNITGVGSNIGGIVGSMQGDITYCYNTGNFNVNNVESSYIAIGGIAGAFNSSSPRTISNTYNTAQIGSGNYSGGIIGHCLNDTENLTNNSNNFYNITNTGVTTGLGGVDTDNVGNIDDVSLGFKGVDYSAMLVTTSGVAPSGMFGLTTEAEGDSWVFVVGKTPLLNGVGEGNEENYSPTWDGVTTFVPTLQDANQANSETNPYIIDSAAKLAWISANYNQSNCYGQYYLQTADIDLNNEPWIPINNTSSNYAYYYDGGNHTILNLNIDLATSNYVGLFGFVCGSANSNTYVKNVTIKNGSVNGASFVGSIVGYGYFLNVINCSNENVNTCGVGNYVGGVVGYIENGYLYGNHNNGNVSGTNYVGGIAGQNYLCSISNSHNGGNILGDGYYIGGMSGYNWQNIISYCSNSGDVTSNSSDYSYVAGIVGYNLLGEITNCYNMGIIKGLSDFVGGIAGENTSSIINNCYNTGLIQGSNDYIGGIAGYVGGTNLNGSRISCCYNIGTVNSLDEVLTNHIGGIVGCIVNTNNYPVQYVSISWCYYNAQTVGSVAIGAFGQGKGYQCYGLTTEEMQGAQNENYMYLSSSFWNFAEGQYPTLKYMTQAETSSGGNWSVATGTVWIFTLLL